MKTIRCQFTFVATCIVAWTASAAPDGFAWTCRTLHPAPGALAAKAAARTLVQEGGARLQAARVRETESRLDRVDVLVAFDKSAQEWVVANKGVTIGRYAQSCVDKMNDCLKQSKLDDAFRFRLAGFVGIGVDASRLMPDPFDNAVAVLDNMISPYGDTVAKGEWKRITDMREEVGADIVSMLIAGSETDCIGLGYSLDMQFLNDAKEAIWTRVPTDEECIVAFGDYAYHVASIQAVDTVYTQVHETGHNMGCGHPDMSCAIEEIGPGPQLHDYSAGYYAWIDKTGYYTIMGYNFGGLQANGTYDPGYIFEPLPCFSSPLLMRRDKHGREIPLGVAGRNDNCRTLRETCRLVAQYRVSKLPSDSPGADIGGEGDPGHEEDPPEGEVGFRKEFRPVKAMNAVYPYVGALYGSGGEVRALVQLKVGKPSARTQESKVTVTFVDMNGKKFASKAVAVPCGMNVKAWFDVKSWGRVDLTLGGEGFKGILHDGSALKTAEVGDALADAKAKFRIGEIDFTPPDKGFDALGYTPDGLPVTTSGTRWTLPKAAAVKYKKVVVDKAARKYRYDLVVGNGKTVDALPNVSALKLTYTAKKGVFKGSFNLYATNEATVPTGKSPKLKKYKVTVNGFVIGGEGRGKATCASVGRSWEVEIR